MAMFPANPTRLDPYKNFKFRLKWDGQYVAAVSKMSALKRTTEVVEHRAGGDPSTSHKSPGRNKYDAITLERGLTQDTAFHDWAGLVWNYGAGLGLYWAVGNIFGIVQQMVMNRTSLGREMREIAAKRARRRAGAPATLQGKR